MSQKFQLAALVLGTVALAMTAWQLRKSGQSPATRRSLHTTMILVAGVFAGVLPSVLAPSNDWLLMTGAIVSMVLTVIAVIISRRPLPPAGS